MVKAKLFFPIILVTIIVNSCADQIVSECGDIQHKDAMRASFSSIVEKLITPTCAQSGCHSGLTPTAGLNMEPGKAYTNLLTRTSTQESAYQLVLPFKSDSSWIMFKLRKQGTTVMPPSGQLPITVIDSIGAWIDNGALNN